MLTWERSDRTLAVGVIRCWLYLSIVNNNTCAIFFFLDRINSHCFSFPSYSTSVATHPWCDYYVSSDRRMVDVCTSLPSYSLYCRYAAGVLSIFLRLHSSDSGRSRYWSQDGSVSLRESVALTGFIWILRPGGTWLLDASSYFELDSDRRRHGLRFIWKPCKVSGHSDLSAVTGFRWGYIATHSFTFYKSFYQVVLSSQNRWSPRSYVFQGIPLIEILNDHVKAVRACKSLHCKMDPNCQSPYRRWGWTQPWHCHVPGWNRIGPNLCVMSMNTRTLAKSLDLFPD